MVKMNLFAANDEDNGSSQFVSSATQTGHSLAAV